MAEVEVIIQPDGSVLIPRGSTEENSILTNVFSDLTKSPIAPFLAISEQSELLFGQEFLCG